MHEDEIQKRIKEPLPTIISIEHFVLLQLFLAIKEII